MVITPHESPTDNHWKFEISSLIIHGRMNKFTEWLEMQLLLNLVVVFANQAIYGLLVINSDLNGPQINGNSQLDRERRWKLSQMTKFKI